MTSFGYVASMHLMAYFDSDSMYREIGNGNAQLTLAEAFGRMPPCPVNVLNTTRPIQPSQAASICL